MLKNWDRKATQFLFGKQLNNYEGEIFRMNLFSPIVFV